MRFEMEEEAAAGQEGRLVSKLQLELQVLALLATEQAKRLDAALPSPPSPPRPRQGASQLAAAPPPPRLRFLGRDLPRSPIVLPRSRAARLLLLGCGVGGAAVGLLYLRDGGRTLAGWLQARRLAGAAP